MRFFTKTKVEVPTGEHKEVEVAELWAVSWTRRTGSFHSDQVKTIEVFLSKKDAEDFKERLIEAQTLLQYTENISIQIYKHR